MIFKKGNQMRPRSFTYQPRFWDETKDEFKRRVADAERKYHGESEEEYTPSRNFKFRSGGSTQTPRDSRFETTYSRVSGIRTIALIILISTVFYLLYRLA